MPQLPHFLLLESGDRLLQEDGRSRIVLYFAGVVTRRHCRERLAELFQGQGFTVTYDYAPVDLAGASKALLIYTLGSRHDRLSRGFTNDFHMFALDVYVKRSDAANDDLDALRTSMQGVILDNVGDSMWDELELDNSRPATVEIAGIPYLEERHLVLVKASRIGN